MTKVDSQQPVCGSLPPRVSLCSSEDSSDPPQRPWLPPRTHCSNQGRQVLVLAHALTAWWWLSVDNFSMFVAPFLGEEAEHRQRVEGQVGWGGSSNGLQMHRPHPERKPCCSPDLHLWQLTDVRGLNTFPCLGVFHHSILSVTNGWKIPPKKLTFFVLFVYKDGFQCPCRLEPRLTAQLTHFLLQLCV